MVDGLSPFVIICSETGISTSGFQSSFEDRINVMSLNRRQFLNLAAGGVATSVLVSRSTWADTRQTIRAIAFDAFTIFDSRPITSLAEEFFPGRGTDLSNLWRTRQFEYTWLRTLYGRYADFWQVTQDSLEFASKMLKLELTDERRQRLMNSYLRLKPFHSSNWMSLRMESVLP
jgi:2-haloacid dehalogenase